MKASPGSHCRRVLIIVENLPVPFDRRVWSEATALRRAGYVVSVICPVGAGAERPEETIEGIHIYRHPLPPEGRSAIGYFKEYATALYWEFRLAFRVSRREGFDAIHICNPPDLLFLVGAFFKLFGRKRLLFDHHDINPELYEAKFGRRDIFWRLLKLFERLTFAFADVSIATNESYRRIAVERGKMPADRVFIVRSGPNLERLRPVPPNPAWKAGRQYLAAYVGVIGESEGVDLLLLAVRHIVRERQRTDVSFVIVGSGPYLDTARALCSELALDDFVRFTGRIDDPTLLEILSTADIGVNPDRWSPFNDKSTMNKTLEYMTLGLPLVQFDSTEGRYSAGDAALYAKRNDPADFGDRILDLLSDPERRRAMGEYARARIVDQLSWDHEEPKLLSAFEKLFEPA
ncbi:MAG TPA: glycosyltransferase family 4 protein [Sphingomicrobium sp.]|nr:glycosyltransferase family 4 protein [Sphingomicrobium sp.]